MEAVPGNDFLFEVHFKDITKAPWRFIALSQVVTTEYILKLHIHQVLLRLQEERSSWIEAITCLLQGSPLYQHPSKEEEKVEVGEEKGHEKEAQTG